MGGNLIRKNWTLYLGQSLVLQNIWNSKLKIVFVSLFIVFLNGCVSTQNAQPDVAILWPEPDRLRFSGKGAGAGMMLMSSMGPSGIAIGIAIDEGIGKDIENSLFAKGYDFKQQFRQRLELTLTECQCAHDIQSVQVSRYGFKSFGSADFDDPIAVELVIVVNRKDGSNDTHRFPEDFSHEVKLLPLEQAKIDGEETTNALNHAIEKGVQHIFGESV